MAIVLNEHLLEQRLVDLEKANNWSPRIISKLESLISGPDDRDLFRINPIRFAKEKNIPENESIDLFIHAAKLGIFTMNWELICPMCSDAAESFAGLSSLHSHLFCNLCNLNFQVDLDDFIMVSFSIHPQIREIKYHKPESLSFEDYLFRYRFSPEGKFNGQMTMPEMLSATGATGSYIEPGSSASFDFHLGEGILRGFDLGNNYGLMIDVSGAPAAEPQILNLSIRRGAFYDEVASIRPGPVRLVVKNSMGNRSVFFAGGAPKMDPRPVMQFDPFLTGKKILSTQSFRNLYRNETFSSTEGIGVKELSFVFTDLKGSTALYDRVGDLKAFNLVRQHFDSLGKVVNKYSGAIVKTIGDAIMATFITPIDALRASIEMMEEIETFNASQANKDIILKIGLHAGACLAVSMNDHMDYFGQTVNIAARVQGLADGDEIFLTETIYNRDDVKKLLGNFVVEQSRARLKGVQEEMPVYKIGHRPRVAA